MYNVKLSNGSRQDVVDYILQQKSVSPDSFSVVDVGGSMVGWSAPYVDAIIDFEIPCADSFDKKLFKCDITHPSDYSEIMEYVETHGKFDFCICTHVLEDIMNPGFVCEQICKIAKGGYIAFPSKYRELSRFEGQYRGHIHHRWIFTIKNEVVYGFPKINYLETNFIFDRVSDISENKSDLSFFWKDTIPLKYINNNFLGPNIASVISYYNNLCDPAYI